MAENENRKPRGVSHCGRRIELPPWRGEFGWEIMSWVPQCRLQAIGCEEVIATSFDGMAPLYADFATEFKSHNQKARSLKYPKKYRPKGLYRKYGRRQECGFSFDCLIHARGTRRKSSINYRRFSDLLSIIKKEVPATCACIGSMEDQRINGIFDMRGIELQDLMNKIAAAKMVIGVSSGLMHLAAACGTDIVVWGDRRTYFGETLEVRYKVTWNPFNVKVGWIDADDFHPEPERIVEKVKEIYESSIAKYSAAAW